MILRYDGSPAGFLTLAGRAIKEKWRVAAVHRSEGEGDLFGAERCIATDAAFAARVDAGLRSRLGAANRRTLLLALLAEEEGAELALLAWLRLGLRLGPDIGARLADPVVNRVHRLARRTAHEQHRLMGLARFERLAGGAWLARLRPRHNVVPLLGSHFAARLADQEWLLHDVERGCAVWGRDGRWRFLPRIELDELALHPEEAEIAGLWRRFYRSIGNDARHNPRLRQQFMPRRYWSFLTELQGEEGGRPEWRAFKPPAE